MQRTNNAHLSAAWKSLAAVAVALTMLLGFGSAASAEDLYPDAYKHVYTHGFTAVNSVGATEYKATSYASDSYAGDSGRVIHNGFNNGQGWHQTDSRDCNFNAPGNCAPIIITFDAGPSSNGTLPGSGSTDRYATAEHFLFWTSGSANYYTSSTGTRSSYYCFSTPGCP